MSSVRIFRHTTQVFRHHIPTEFLLLGFIEFLALMAALYLGLETRFLGDRWEAGIGAFFPKALLYASVMLLSLIALGAYQKQAGRLWEVTVLRIGSGLLLGLTPLAASYYFAPTYFLGRGVLALTVAYSFALVLVTRFLFCRLMGTHGLWPRTLVLGAGERAALIHQAADAGELQGLDIIAYVPVNGEAHNAVTSDRIALDVPLVTYVQDKGIDEIVLAVDDRRAGLPNEELLDCKMSGVDILDLQTFFERRTGKIRLDILNPSWLYLSEGFRESAFRNLTKRVFDIAAVTALLPLAVPFMLLASVLILLESRGRGPILYRQTRVGRDGKPFQIYKFRSMATDAEQDGVARWAAEDDARITWAGAFLRKGRLDELPQLFNILKGDMSFVGPRPERPEFVQQLAANIPFYDERHRVKPGLTGWAQIRFTYGASEEEAREKLQYDLYYVKNYNMLLDLVILLQTAEVVLMGEGVR
jgi:sugar transferase (PEP-CTERM system associated)